MSGPDGTRTYLAAKGRVAVRSR